MGLSVKIVVITHQNNRLMCDCKTIQCLNIEIDNKSPYFVYDDGVLFDQSKKTLIHYTASKKNDYYIIPETVTWIGKHSFYKCMNLKCIQERTTKHSPDERCIILVTVLFLQGEITV